MESLSGVSQVNRAGGLPAAGGWTGGRAGSTRVAGSPSAASIPCAAAAYSWGVRADRTAGIARTSAASQSISL